MTTTNLNDKYKNPTEALSENVIDACALLECGGVVWIYADNDVMTWIGPRHYESDRDGSKASARFTCTDAEAEELICMGAERN